ncbi:MAG: bifunctional diaminohydroxyphosphoribosylaminopyrimidine deaminase/5-amino-6-(5-phosphoribosylamino)uracil reductase RibD [Candidatus Gastranaerophilales bacterium]|nr:bifunctional diaminohydroxyphosphoribosylaminopyrimidine deaminase/5-amino-6-(5-phosphoribosylamino)uracil reductase RibD [Candidatus Gastranaerophilales bacterium]
MDSSKYIKMCFELAKKGGHDVMPNPLVGAVIVKNGKIISTGYHEKFGGFHAERNAILNSKENVEGAVLYVNLEPCSHFGKTPPCTDLIIEKKIKKVVFAMHDVNPKVNGEDVLKSNGIDVAGGILEDEARELNKVFIKNILFNLPYIAIKTAATLDSKIATVNYNSKWITGNSSREEVMRLRSFYQAILTGSNTVKIDNPKLTSRMEGGINPVRIIIDRKGRLSLRANVFKNDGTRIIVADNSEKKYPKHIEKISFKNMKNLFKTLYKMGIYSIMGESGSKLNSVIIKEKLADEIYQFIAPKILGGGYNFVSGLDPVYISNSIHTKNLLISRFDEDILLNYKLVYDKRRS